MKTIKYRAWDKKEKRMIDADSWFFSEEFEPFVDSCRKCQEDFEVMQFTGYQMFDEDVYFDDLVSNNLGTSKEVIRQIVEHEGCIMMKRIRGSSSLPKYISLHEWHKLNFKIIGNIYENNNAKA